MGINEKMGTALLLLSLRSPFIGRLMKESGHWHSLPPLLGVTPPSCSPSGIGQVMKGNGHSLPSLSSRF